MGLPLSQAISINPLLSNFSVAKKQNLAKVLFAEKVLPPVPTGGKQTGTYRVWDDTTFVLSTGSVRPPGAQYTRGINSTFQRIKPLIATSTTFTTAEYGLELPLDRREAARADAPLQLQKVYNDVCARMVLYAQEQRMVNLAFATANVPTNTTLSGTQQWSDYTNSDPVNDIQTNITSITTNSMLHPDNDDYELCMLCSDQTWNKLKFHPQFQAIFALNRSKFVKPEDFMEFFNFTEIDISYGIANSANEGQTATFARFIGKDFLIFYRQKGTPTLESATFGVTFQEDPLISYNYPENQTNSDVIRNSHATAEALPSSKSAALLKAVIA